MEFTKPTLKTQLTFNKQPTADAKTKQDHNDKSLSWEDNYFGCWKCDWYFNNVMQLQLHDKKVHGANHSPKHDILTINKNFSLLNIDHQISIVDALASKLSQFNLKN
jgi:hypothetical protein